MAANKKALPYLPKGASLNSLTYQQLQEWAANIYKKTSKKALGFPAGEKGLMHRFFQGYLYPSFTDSTLLKFRSPAAAAMWEYFKRLWSYVQPSSLVYSTMMLTINSFKVFDLIYVMTGGGPGRATNVLVYAIYNAAFIEFDYGYSSAMALVLFILVLAITILQFRTEKKWVSYL